MLAEVLFDPTPGSSPFVEILNTAAVALPLAGVSVRLEAGTIAIDLQQPSLGPGERLLVAFDTSMPGPGRAADVAQLVDSTGYLLDRVAWGDGQANAVSLTVGDFEPDAIEPGSTIGRPPGANQTNQPTEWVVYEPDLASAGVPNPVPPVAVLLPLDGAVLDGPVQTIQWYPATSAASYRVQIAADDTFASVAVDTTVTDPQLDISSLAPGTYAWRVTSIAADGSTSADSAPSRFELNADTARLEGFRHQGRVAAVPPPLNLSIVPQLQVPWLVQHKDSPMLLLEDPNEHGPHAWDAAHASASRFDPADQKNCALAMVAMVNHFYGGDLTQDRIGYEELKDRQAGPEQDLMYGTGLNIPQVNNAFEFALGAPVTFIPEAASYDEVWATITTEIDAGRPVAGANTHHGFVVTGYATKDGHRLFSVNDPAIGQYTIDLDAAKVPASDLSLWLMPHDAVGRQQEPEVTTDSDGDAVVDFDETERFRTDAFSPDTDEDKVRDKQDIASGIFDPSYGYARNPVPGGPGRDFDSDAIPTERDRDSDSGGCRDGTEDKDFDGHRAGKETWNFAVDDDECQRYSLTVTHETTGGPRDPTRLVMTGVVDQDDPGGEPSFSGLGQGSGSYLHADMSQGCIADSYSGTITFSAVIVDDELQVYALPTDPFILAFYGGTVPKEGGTVKVEKQPVYGPDDHPTGIPLCEDFSLVADTVTATPLGPAP